ncbi:MAG: M67 family metallopeptidase [Acidobacteria bacterium]|nr:M67 family metallopeptidase [Acidobacteriota bacterium]MCA1651576.1 M67 family metallopeptidase [Acidobacteriota bacterium]
MVQVRQSVLDDVASHAREEAPFECCGLLVASEGVIVESVRIRNLERSRTRYLIDPAQQIETNRRLRGTGRSVAGAYHSHPDSPAVPSPSDLAEAHYSEFVYIIVSLADAQKPNVRGYRLEGGNFDPVALVPVP